MFPNFLQLVAARPPLTPGGGFVQDVEVQEHVPRDPRVVRFILICWVLIAVKHVAVIWAVWHYHVPFHQLWINFPTWLLGALATAIYYGRTRRG